MHRRSLTILEMLIALALLLAMAAIVAPSLLNTLEERAFETAADETNEQLMMARAHAQATGTPIEVTYSAGKSQVQARVFSPMADVGAIADSGGEPVHEPWALRFLGRGVRIVARKPVSESAAVDPMVAELPIPDDVETLEDLGKGQDVRLAVFMPDGTALMSDRVWLNDAKGRLGVFTINPWSGLPFFERLADLTAEVIEDLQNAPPQKR
jgi:hypothetical protein